MDAEAGEQPTGASADPAARGRAYAGKEARAADRFSAEQRLQFLQGVGPKRAALLEKLGLVTVGDLVRHFPRRYEDRRQLTPISRVEPGSMQVLYGEIADIRSRLLRGGQTLIEAVLVDKGSTGALPGRIHLVWFHQPHLLELLRAGMHVYAYGEARIHRDRLQMTSPEFEIDSVEDSEGEASPHVERIVPIYPLTKGISQRYLRGLAYRIVQGFTGDVGPYDHFHPDGLDESSALRCIHFPDEWKDVDAGRARFIFEERFVFASHVVFRRQSCRCPVKARYTVTEELDRKIRSVFPFRLTAEQDRVIGEISRDLSSESSMYRLLQGDVGTGKTAIALYAMLVCVRNGTQAALLAPTEVLAEQHHRTITRFLSPHPVRVELLTGSVRGERRQEILDGLQSGKVHIVIGTQALIQDSVKLKRLGLCVIDEQHRFGVIERLKIRKKGDEPHVLVMTATPIPRSLCLTCYGDLDLSVLRERPAGRRPVKTLLVPPRKRSSAMELIRSELAAGRQAYFIYPLIEESEALSLPAAVEARDKLQQEVFPEHRVGLVHGGLPSDVKESELDRFRAGHYQILVATVVVEVGIDVPNATVIVIEDASRFGLAQLHQLRGRVGRGGEQGYCLVGVSTASRDVMARLEVFAATDDGFKIAEEDLKLRGPGDYLGVRQSGKANFLLGNPLEDLEGFLRVQELAQRFWTDEGNAPYRRKWSRQLELGGAEGEFVGLD